MNRRDFFKLIGLGTVAAASVPLLGMVQQPEVIKPPSELDDLYAYLESKTIQHPIKGVIPYKLYPYQKEILKHIHENDNLVIVKARQIGMTTMLAGYSAWMSHKRNLIDFYDGCKDVCRKDYKQRRKWFHPAKFNKKVNDSFQLYYADEYNYRGIFCIPRSKNEKNVVAGSHDKEGSLLRFIKNHPHFKVIYCPVNKCVGSWDADRIESCRPYYTIKEWQREMECQYIV